jgi:hypothetical protein
VLGVAEGFGVGDGFTARAVEAAPKMRQQMHASSNGKAGRLFFEGVFTIIGEGDGGYGM